MLTGRQGLMLGEQYLRTGMSRCLHVESPAQILRENSTFEQGCLKDDYSIKAILVALSW